MLTVRPISADETLPLRHAVLRPDRPIRESRFKGDEDPTTLHVGALLDGAVVAIASVYLEGRADDAPGTAWRLRGMASAPEVRGSGTGAAALAACEAHVREQGGTMIWCNARTGAVGFYEAHDWRVLGEEFDIPTIGPHFVMEKPVGDRVS